MRRFRRALCAFALIAACALLACDVALADGGAAAAAGAPPASPATATATLATATATATLATATATATATPATATASPIGAHSMLQLNAPFSFKQRMFEEAAAMHASTIRLDVQPSMVFAYPGQPPDFGGLDEVLSLAQQYHLRVVADLLSVPWWIASCEQPPATWDAVTRCGTTDLADYQTMIGQIVSHADPVIRDWEIWNEPDDPGFFGGTPEQYAQMLRAAHDTIKQIDPQANVLLGGVSRASATSWLAQVFAAPGADAAHAFDIANVHERGRLAALAPDITTWKKFLAGYGFTGPLWVTEHGYPADPAYQYDPGFAGGEASQAAYLTASIPTLLDAGAGEVFVTERDNLGGEFASEGVLSGDVLDPPTDDPLVVERPSYDAVSALAQCYVALGRACPGPAPAAAPSSVALAATPVGSFVVSTVTVSNPGTEPLRLGKASLAVPTRAGFALGNDSCSGQMLEPAQTCAITLGYAPVAGGAAGATLQVPSDNGTLSVGVTGQGVSVSELTWSKTPFQPTGAFDREGEVQRLTVAVTNPLPAAIPVTAAALAPGYARGFAIASDGCLRVSLAPRASCQVSVVYRPARLGAALAALTLRGASGQLAIGLRAEPFAPPAVTRLVGSDRTYCFGPRSHNQIVVVTDQPAAVSWQVLRRQYSLAPRCGHGSATHPPRGRGRRGWAAGQVATVAALRLIRGTGRSVARFALPVGSRGGLAPGTYLLSASARNRHGASAPQGVWITVAP